MKTFRLTFSCTGQATALPNAQTLFGALCTAIRMRDGQKKLNEYLDSFHSKPWFIHSSMFPLDLFPPAAEPLISLQDLHPMIVNLPDADKLGVLAQLKKYKKYQYMSSYVFEHYVLKGDFAKLRKLLIGNSEIDVILKGGYNVLARLDDPEEKTLMKSVLMTRSGSADGKLEKDLFYTPEMFFSTSSRFAVYVKSNLDSKKLSRYFSLLEYTGAGPDRSTGKNLFRLETIEPFESKRTVKQVFLLSGCIPQQDEFDYESSAYKIESSLYRGSFEVVGDELIGRFGKLMAGSLMKPVQQKEWYGQVLDTKVNGKRICHYGLGFVL